MQLLRYLWSQWNHTQCESKRSIYTKKGKQRYTTGKYCMYCIRPKHHFGKHMDNNGVMYDTEK